MANKHHASPPLGKRNWKPEEETYLMEMWGSKSITAIAKNLNRTVDAIKIRARCLGLGAVLMGGDYITLNQLLIAVKGTNAGGNYIMTSWGEKRGLPVHRKKVEKNSFKIVYLDEFWEWAEKNRSFIDFSKMEPLILGEEPPWVAEQRKKDYKANALQRKDPWTAEEDSRLKMLLKQHMYGYAELSQMLCRSEGAILRRCIDLRIKERPLKADNHGKEAQWTERDFEILAEGIKNGDSYAVIGKSIGKSEKAIRGKVCFTYLTENADKVRTYLGDGAWGSGAPIPTVKQAVHLSRTRTATKNDLEVLCAVLKYRTLQLRGADYDHYFQRAMCMHWDALTGVCTAGEKDCDFCNHFERIKPQYCVRCGATFYEREENSRCARCRAARKSQYARKAAVLNRIYKKQLQ